MMNKVEIIVDPNSFMYYNSYTVKGNDQRADKAGPIELARLATNIRKF